MSDFADCDSGRNPEIALLTDLVRCYPNGSRQRYWSTQPRLPPTRVSSAGARRSTRAHHQTQRRCPIDLGYTVFFVDGPKRVHFRRARRSLLGRVNS